MFPFSFLAARSFQENALSTDTVCDRLSSEDVSSDHVGSKRQNNASAAQREKLGGYGFPPMPTKHKTIDHELATDYSCYEKAYYEKAYYEKEYVNDRYHRFSKMSQAPVWQTMSALSLNHLIQQFSSTDIGIEDFQGEEPRGVYADVKIGEHSLRLQALAWTNNKVPEQAVCEPTKREKGALEEEDTLEEDSGEKTVQADLSAEGDLRLLLVLGPMAGSYLPIGTSLTIAENNLLHSTPHLRWSSSCLYTQVFGDWRKQFTVKILLPNALPKTLPALTFEY